jgi:DNA-binding NtrC family response regulator
MKKTTVTRQGLAPQSISAPVFVVLHTPDGRFRLGDRLPLLRSQIIGREPGSRGTEIDDEAVSRRHVKITWHGDHGLTELDDLDSKNGTFVNGLQVQRRYLEPGDIVRVGDSIFAVRQEPKQQQPEAAGDAGGRTLVATFSAAGDRSAGLPKAAELPDIVGNSLAIMELKSQLALAAGGDLPVLLLGDTGTGKELAARAIHDLSGRRGRFEPVNCSAVPENLFESIFFGHQAGAFTGANGDSPGVLAACDGGTLFLDEVGDLPLVAQPKLLRFLEDGIVRPLGGTLQRKLDVRIVAATNASVKKMEQRGEFRSDLIGRLEGLTLTMPPLSKRREDVLPLLFHFARKEGFPNLKLEPDAAEALLVAPWNRNVRELKLLVAKWAQMVWPRRSSSDRPVPVLPEDTPECMLATVMHRDQAPIPPEVVASRRPSREELVRLLEQHEGNVTQVAMALNRDRKQVYRWIDRYGLER